MTEPETDAALKRLRKELAELREEVGHQAADVRLSAAMTALSAVVLAFTAAPWFWVDTDDGDFAITLWGVGDYGFWGVVAIVLVLAVAGATLIYERFPTPTPSAHWTQCGLGVVTGLVLLFLPRSVDDEDVTSGSGLWLTLLAVLVLAGVHGTHGDALRSRRRWLPASRY